MRPLLIGGDRAGFPRDVYPRDPQWPLDVGPQMGGSDRGGSLISLV
jgi:hypothetical protein